MSGLGRGAVTDLEPLLSPKVYVLNFRRPVGQVLAQGRNKTHGKGRRISWH